MFSKELPGGANSFPTEFLNRSLESVGFVSRHVVLNVCYYLTSVTVLEGGSMEWDLDLGRVGPIWDLDSSTFALVSAVWLRWPPLVSVGAVLVLAEDNVTSVFRRCVCILRL